MSHEISELEDLFLDENYVEALKVVEKALAKSPKNIGFLKQKASLILHAPGSKFTLQDAEKCLLRAHQLAPLNLDILNDLARFYEKDLPNPERRDHFYNLFCSIVDRKIGEA